MTMAASLKDTWGQPLLFLRGCTNLIKNLGENNMPRFFQHLTRQSNPFKLTTIKKFIVMPLSDTNSLLRTSPYNVDIKCQCNSESYE